MLHGRDENELVPLPAARSFRLGFDEVKEHFEEAGLVFREGSEVMVIEDGGGWWLIQLSRAVRAMPKTIEN